MKCLDLSQFRPVYAPKDFLDVISNIRNPNVRDSAFAGSYVFQDLLFVKRILSCGIVYFTFSHRFRHFTKLGVIQVPLNVKDVQDLVRRYLNIIIRKIPKTYNE